MIKSGIQWMKSSKNRTIIDLHADLSLVISMVADELPDDPAAAKLFCIGRMFLYPVFCTYVTVFFSFLFFGFSSVFCVFSFSVVTCLTDVWVIWGPKAACNWIALDSFLACFLFFSLK